MTFTGTDIDLLALADEMTATNTRLVGQILQVTPNEKGGWGILLSRRPESLGNPVEGERDSGLKPNTIPL